MCFFWVSACKSAQVQGLEADSVHGMFRVQGLRGCNCCTGSLKVSVVSCYWACCWDYHQLKIHQLKIAPVPIEARANIFKSGLIW